VRVIAADTTEDGRGPADSGREGSPRPGVRPEVDSRFYRGLLDSLKDGVCFVDRDLLVTYWNRGAEDLTGFLAADVVGKPCHDVIRCREEDGASREKPRDCSHALVLGDGAERVHNSFIARADGRRIPVTIRNTPIRDDEGEVVGVAQVISDASPHIAARREAHRLETMAFRDSLTELGNRRFAEMTLESRLAEMERYGWPFGALFADLDDFKKINDRHGHEVGDRLLRAVAGTIEGSLRTFDVATRWGGEEFLVIVANVDATALLRIADRIRSLVSKTEVSTGTGDEVAVTISIGATLAREGDTVHSLVSRADRFMYEGKRAGKGRVTLGDESRGKLRRRARGE